MVLVGQHAPGASRTISGISRWHIGDCAFERSSCLVYASILPKQAAAHANTSRTADIELLTLLLRPAVFRLPFLRHTPLKELYKLSKHLTASRFNRGDVLISQVRLLTWKDWLPCN